MKKYFIFTAILLLSGFSLAQQPPVPGPASPPTPIVEPGNINPTNKPLVNTPKQSTLNPASRNVTPTTFSTTSTTLFGTSRVTSTTSTTMR